MEINAEKTKLMTNNTNINDINEEIKVNGQKLETVTSFKYLGSVVCDEGAHQLYLRSERNTPVIQNWFQPC